MKAIKITTFCPSQSEYFELSNWPTVSEGQSWVEARLAQVSAINARSGETITLSDNSRENLSFTPLCNRTSFSGLLPRKPYCADEFNAGICIRSREQSLTKMHVQYNEPYRLRWLIHDLDFGGAALAHRDSNLPPPNVIMINRKNRHAHSAVLLESPVARHSAARRKPLAYYAAIERGFARRLGADFSYSGLLAKNALYPGWDVEWRREEPYSLDELSDWLFKRDMVPAARSSDSFGTSRNVFCFEEMRRWGYRNFRRFIRTGEPFERFQSALHAIGQSINQHFVSALGPAEIWAITRSVSKWIWRHFSDDGFRARQSWLGKKGMVARWRGHIADSTTRPWQRLGISRSTYYRQKKLGTLKRDGE